MGKIELLQATEVDVSKDQALVPKVMVPEHIQIQHSFQVEHQSLT